MENEKLKIGRKTTSPQIAAAISALEDLLKIDLIKDSDLYSGEFTHIIERLKDDEFKISVVGEFSSGKSTFLNALIGSDILKHGVKETTATITEIKNTPLAEDNRLFDVLFYDGTKKENIRIEQIKDFTVTGSAVCSVAQDIEKVTIKSNFLGMDGNVCFVDTPGLNGIADKHKEKTIEQIKDSHACFYLLQIRGLSQRDIDFLKIIYKYQRNIIFIQNFIDELKKFEGETPEQKIATQKKILDEKVFADVEGVDYTIIPVSAKKALLARDKTIKENDGIALTEELREKYLRDSNFSQVFEAIESLVERNEKEKIQQRDSMNVALELLNQLHKVLVVSTQKEVDDFYDSAEGRKIKSIEAIIATLTENREKYKKNLENFVEAGSGEIWRKLSKKIGKVKKDGSLKDVENGNLIESIYESVEQDINPIKEIDSFDDYVKTELANKVNENVFKAQKTCNDFLNIAFENLMNDALLRVEHYTKLNVNVSNLKRQDFGDASNPEDLPRFERDEYEIEKLEKESYLKKAELDKLKKQIKNSDADLSKKRNELNSVKENAARIERQKAEKLSQLGAMPASEHKTRQETVSEYRGGFFGSIADFFAGPKQVTKSVPYVDDTKKKAWLKKNAEIENEFNQKINAIQSQVRMLETAFKNQQNDLEHDKKILPEKENSLSNLHNKIRLKTESLELQRTKAKAEYLKNCKRDILKKVESYLENDVFDSFVACFEEAVKKHKGIVLKNVFELFDLSFYGKISSLKSKISSEDSIEYIGKSKNAIEQIENTKKILEDSLCRI